MKISRSLSILTAALLSASLCLTSCLSDDFGDFGEFGELANFDKSFTEFFPETGEYGESYDDEEDDEIDQGIEDTILAFSSAFEEFTPENEYYIGRTVAASVLAKYPLYKGAPKTQQYLNLICGAITVNSALPYLYRGYWVGILDTDEITAYSTPGGHIFISRGLIACAKSEDELAAAIAHEVAHIQLRHNINSISASRFKNAGLKAADTLRKIAKEDEEDDLIFGKSEYLKEMEDELWNMETELAEKIIDSGYSKVQEFDADNKALVLLNDAGYDPNALIDILTTMKENKNSSIDDKGWFKTHPSPEKRIKNASSQLKKYAKNSYDRSPREKRFADNTK